MALDKRQKDFCKFKAQGFSNVNSAIKAGYSEKTAKTKAHLWLDKSEIKDELTRLRKKTAEIADEKFGIDQSWIVSGIKNVIETAQAAEKPDFSAQLKGYDMLGKISGIYEADNSQKSLLNAQALKIEIVE